MGNVRRFPQLYPRSGEPMASAATVCREFGCIIAPAQTGAERGVWGQQECVYIVLVRFTGSLTSWYTGGKKTTRHMFPLSGHIFGPNWRIFDLIWHLQYNSQLNCPVYSWAVSPTATIYTDPCYCNCYVLVTSFSLSWVAKPPAVILVTFLSFWLNRKFLISKFLIVVNNSREPRQEEEVLLMLFVGRYRLGRRSREKGSLLHTTARPNPFARQKPKLFTLFVFDKSPWKCLA